MWFPVAITERLWLSPKEHVRFTWWKKCFIPWSWQQLFICMFFNMHITFTKKGNCIYSSNCSILTPLQSNSHKTQLHKIIFPKSLDHLGKFCFGWLWMAQVPSAHSLKQWTPWFFSWRRHVKIPIFINIPKPH